MTHKWFGDAYIMLGFSAGYVVVISTHQHEIGEELFQAKPPDLLVRTQRHVRAHTRIT